MGLPNSACFLLAEYLNGKSVLHIIFYSISFPSIYCIESCVFRIVHKNEKKLNLIPRKEYIHTSIYVNFINSPVLSYELQNRFSVS